MMIAVAFIIYVSAFVYYEPINRQSREPDPELGYTVPHDIKGATFYVTPLEDQLLDIHDVAFFVFAGSILVVAFIDKALQSRRRSSAVTGLPFTRSDGLPVPVRFIALVISLACLSIWLLQTPYAEQYGPGLPEGYGSEHIWTGVLVGVLCLLYPKRVWSVGEGGLTREVHGLLGKKVDHFGPSEITKVTVTEDIRRSGRTFYRLRIVLTSGRKISFEVGDAFSDAWAIKTALEDAIA